MTDGHFGWHALVFVGMGGASAEYAHEDEGMPPNVSHRVLAGQGLPYFEASAPTQPHRGYGP